MFIIRRLYDEMAALVRVILDCTDEKFFEEYSVLTQSKQDELNRILGENFPELFNNGHVVQISVSLYNDSFFERLALLKTGEMDEHKKQILVTLLNKLDNCLSKSIENYSTEVEIEGINSNAEITRIQLLPRTKCAWEHHSRGSSHSDDLLNYLYFFYYIDLDKAEDYKIRNYFLPCETFEAATKRGYLEIALCPLSDQGKLTWITEEREGKGYFSVTGVENHHVVESNLLELKDELKRRQADIVVMPEMLGSYQMLKKFRENLSEFPDDGMENPPLIIFPSIWKDRHNIVTVLNESGDIIIQQEKQYRYTYPASKMEKYLEDILPERKISLIHCEGIGRIAVLICKDALIKKYIQMVLNVLKVTLLIVPSFSTGNYDFKEISQYCRASDCCVCWINTCSVINMVGASENKLETIGFFLRCGKESLFGNGTFLCARSEQKCGSGGIKDCAHCIFLHRIEFG